MNKIVMITGGNGGIGKTISRTIAQHNAEVIIVGRNKLKCDEVVEELKKDIQNPKISCEIADVSCYASVRALAKRYRETGKPLHVLINNAAVVPESRQETSEGIELSWATNVMGYYWMMREFKDILAASAPSRVVNVASNYAGGLDIKDVQYSKRTYDANEAYRQSKQADRMLSGYFGNAWKDLGISVNSCHPGVVGTKLLKDLGFGGRDSLETAAATPVMLAVTDVGQTVSGKYFSSKEDRECKFSKNLVAAEELNNLCEQLTTTIIKKLEQL